LIAVSKLVPTEVNSLPGDFGLRIARLIVKALLNRILVTAGLLTVLGGCATVPEETTEDLVGQRAIEWAETLIALDYDGALSYMTPSYQASPRADRYRGDFSGAGFWRSVTLHSVDCGEDQPASRCNVRVIISMIRPPELTREMPIPYDTTWVFIDGMWYQYRK
jgi:hypothetical protein